MRRTFLLILIAAGLFLSFGTAGILRRKLDIVRVFLRPADRPHGLLDHLVGLPARGLNSGNHEVATRVALVRSGLRHVPQASES